MQLTHRITWSRNGVGYECSTQGDHRFSALYARMPDGRTIEQHYQCDVKGYDPGGKNWRLGKGKPPLRANVDLWTEYLNLWKTWAKTNVDELDDLRQKARYFRHNLTDVYAATPVNQAHALACILNGEDE